MIPRPSVRSLNLKTLQVRAITWLSRSHCFRNFHFQSVLRWIKRWTTNPTHWFSRKEKFKLNLSSGKEISLQKKKHKDKLWSINAYVYNSPVLIHSLSITGIPSCISPLRNRFSWDVTRGERCVTSLKTAAKETTFAPAYWNVWQRSRLKLHGGREHREHINEKINKTVYMGMYRLWIIVLDMK